MVRAGRCMGIVAAALVGTAFFAALSRETPGDAAPAYRAALLSHSARAPQGAAEELVCQSAQATHRDRLVTGQVCLPGGATALATTAVNWRDDERRDIGGLGGEVSVATAVNNHNVVVGYANTPNVPAIRAFRWSESKGIEALPRLVEGVPAEPKDINDSGVVVGRAGTSFFANEAVFWDARGAIHRLPRLYKTSDIGVLAINNHGVMVGQELAPDFEPEARLWMNGRVYRLQSLVPNLPEEYRLRAATSINDDGDIVANASVLDKGQVRLVTVLLKAGAGPR